MTLALGLAGLLTACGGGRTGDAAQSIGPVENAHLHMYMNLSDFLDSSYVQQVRERIEGADGVEFTDNFDELKTETGVDFRELSGILVSANLDGIDFMNPEPEPIRNLSGHAVFGFKSALTMEQLHAVLNLLVEDSNGELRLESGTAAGQDIRLIHFVHEPEAPQVHVALAPDGKAVVATLNAASLERALAQAGSGRTPSQRAELTAALRSLSGKQYQAVMVFPDELREIMRAQAAEAMAMDAMTGQMMAPFQNIGAMMISAHAGDNLDLSLKGDFGSAEAANQAKAQLTMLKGFMTMGLQGQGVDGLLSIAQSMEPEADGNLGGMSLTLTPEATESLAEDMMQIMMMRMMGGGF